MVKKPVAQVGQLFCTHGYRLPCDYVLHAVSASNSEAFKSVKQLQKTLVQLYKKIFTDAAQLYPSDVPITIAMPVLSNGAPRDENLSEDCVESLAMALEEMLPKKLSRFEAVYLVNMDAQVSERLLQCLKKCNSLSQRPDNSGEQLIRPGLNPFASKQAGIVHTDGIIAYSSAILKQLKRR